LSKEKKMRLSNEVIQGPYFHDLMVQPKAVEQTLKGLIAQRDFSELLKKSLGQDLRRIVLTGMGSSFHALHPLHLRLVERGWSSLMVETSELIHYQRNLLDSSTPVVAVSQSGASVEMIRLLEIAGQVTPIIGITNTPESPLAKGARAVLYTAAGEEYTVSCKTYLATLMALEWLGGLLNNEGTVRPETILAEAAAPIQQYLSAWASHVDQLSELLLEAKTLYLVGRGASLSTTGTGGLILKESTHQQAEGMSCAAFRHGPMEMLNREVFVLIFAGAAKTRQLNENLLQEVQSMGSRAALVGGNQLGVFAQAHDAEELRPLMEILPVEMVTLARSALLGREAGRFERASKVTHTE
jgi:glucosamine--fructose-6-phosphate aminotransferase (isomerizing)